MLKFESFAMRIVVEVPGDTSIAGNTRRLPFCAVFATFWAACADVARRAAVTTPTKAAAVHFEVNRMTRFSFTRSRFTAGA
jgi:hypothetical protein